MTFEVAIIGGGVGGLCLAHGLRGRGVPVTVHERDRHPEGQLQGYRIRINPHGADALRACLSPPVWREFLGCAGTSNSGHGFLTEKLKQLLVIGYDEGEGQPESTTGHYSASRTGLRRSLMRGLEDITYCGHAFLRYEERADGRTTCFFSDGSTVTADLVVGADGANSRVRKQYLPHAERVDTGMASVAGRVPLARSLADALPSSLLARPNTVLASRGCGMFLAPHRLEGGDLAHATENYLMWAFGAGRQRYPSRTLSALAGAELRDLIGANIQDWHPALKALVAGTDPATITAIPIQTSVPVPPWRTTGVTLLGDAIHSMTPLRGVGANTALRDAALLTRCLADAAGSGTGLLQAVHDYEAEMIRYGFRAVRDSRKAADMFISENPVRRFAFKAALRAADHVPPIRRPLARQI
jgi:salicylate hydroxylase